MRVYEQTNGYRYEHDGISVVFPFGLETAPRLVFGDSLVTIEQPERYGRTNTVAERYAWVRAFVADTKTPACD